MGCDCQQLRGFTGAPLPENLKVNVEELREQLQLQGAPLAWIWKTAAWKSIIIYGWVGKVAGCHPVTCGKFKLGFV